MDGNIHVFMLFRHTQGSKSVGDTERQCERIINGNIHVFMLF